MKKTNIGAIGPSSAGNTSTSEREACEKGAENANNPAFCETTYGGTGTLFEACMTGFGAPVDMGSPPADDGTDTSEPEPCTAEAGSFGWLLCPLITGVSKGIDSIMGLITEQLEYTILANDSDAMLTAWQTFLPIANIAFVIAFLVIIYSTATSTGISNYGIKKILPRLIIAAILVNLSFYICAVIVDVVNIVGNGVKDLIDGITNQIIITRSGGSDEWGSNPFTVAAGALVLGGGALATVILVVLNLGTVLLAILMIFAMLAFRNVLITILIIISPIAFVLWLLPNTEKWFKRWLQEFLRMLFVFPAIAAVWAASQLVIAIITIGSDANLIGFIMAVLVAIAPAFAILPIMKMGGQAMGALQKLSDRGLRATKLDKGLNAWGRDKGGQALDAGKSLSSRDNRFLRGVGGALRYNERRKAQQQGREHRRQMTSAEYIADRASRDDSFARSLGGGDLATGQAMAASMEAKVQKEERENAAAALKRIPGVYDDFYALIGRANNTALSDAERNVALARASELATPSQDSINRLLNAASNMRAGSERSDAANLVSQSAAWRADPSLGGGSIGFVTRGGAGGNYGDAETTRNMQAHRMSRIPSSINANTMATMDERALEDFIDTLNNRDAVIAARVEQGGTQAEAEQEFDNMSSSLLGAIEDATNDGRLAPQITDDKLAQMQRVLDATGNPNAGHRVANPNPGGGGPPTVLGRTT